MRRNSKKAIRQTNSNLSSISRVRFSLEWVATQGSPFVEAATGNKREITLAVISFFSLSALFIIDTADLKCYTMVIMNKNGGVTKWQKAYRTFLPSSKSKTLKW